VRQLNGNLHVGPGADAFQHPGDRGFCRVVPESHIGVGDPCVGQDGGRLDGQQRRTRERKMAEMDEVPVETSKPAGSVHGHVEEPGPQTSNVCSTSNISAAVGLRPVNCSNSAATSSASGFRTNVISVFV
jgi:hypothetical protein